MPCLVVMLALAFPRLVIAATWFFSDWFVGVFPTVVWPILGLLFLPTTLLWYVGVQRWYGGAWTFWPLVGLAIAMMLDGVPGMLNRARWRKEKE